MIAIAAAFVKGNNRQLELHNGFAPLVPRCNVGFKHQKTPGADAFNGGKGKAFRVMSALAPFNRVQVSIDRISQKPDALVAAHQMLELVEALRLAAMPPDFAITALGVGGYPDRLTWLIKLVQKPTRRPIPTTKLRSGLKITFVDGLGDPRSKGRQVIGLENYLLFILHGR